MILKIINKISKKLKLLVVNYRYKNLTTREVFEKIYNENQWNKKSNVMNSGPGSHDHMLVDPYINFVRSFLKVKKNLKVIDLGCGDFNIGSKIFDLSLSYIGIDIVQNLVEYNKKIYRDEKLNFQCLDFIEQEIPNGDCVILRQVLQHLDNKAILKILKKITNFKYLILTEHIPKGEFKSNIDKPIGPTVRLHINNSGVDIESSPFNFSYIEKKEISVEDVELGGEHKTVIYSI